MLDSNLFIFKAKVLKNSVAIFFEKPGTESEKPITGDEESQNAPHNDLINAFSRLKIHYAIYCGFVKEKDVKKIDDYKEELVADIQVTGFTIKGGESMDSFVLSGWKKVPKGTIGPNTPIIRNVKEGGDGYIFIDDLIQNIQLCQVELEHYKNGKYAPNTQQELFTNGEEK